MGKVTAILALCASAAFGGIGTGFEFRGDTGKPFDGSSLEWVEGDNWHMQGDTAWGPTGAFYSQQFWTTEPCDAFTVTFGARGAGGFGGIALMACPNCDQTATNPLVNRFELLDPSTVGAAPVGLSGEWTMDSAIFFGSNEWHHYAFIYKPADRLWTWFKDGLKQGQTNATTNAFTGGWLTNGVMVLQSLTLPLAIGRPELDLLTATHGGRTDGDIYGEYLAWHVRRYGRTFDDPFTLAFTVQGIPRAIADSSSVTTNTDAIVTANFWNASRFDQLVSVAVLRGAATWGFSVDNGYYVDPCGLVSNQADGVATVTITATNSGERPFVRAFNQPVTLASAAESNRLYKTGEAGSLRAAASEWVDAHIGRGQRSQWAVWDHVATNYQRATNGWAYDAIGLEAASVWNSRKNSGGVSPTLIAPDLALGCGHSMLVPGNVVRWVSKGNVIVERTVAASTRLDPAGVYIDWPDLSLYRLASPVTNIPFAPIFPVTWSAYLPAHPEAYAPGNGYGVPMVRISQTGRVDVLDVRTFGDSAYYGRSEDPARAAYFGALEGLDSGNPNFILVNGTAVVASVWSTYAYNGTFTGSISNEMWEAACTRIGSTNRPTYFPLSNFTEYP